MSENGGDEPGGRDDRGRATDGQGNPQSGQRAQRGQRQHAGGGQGGPRARQGGGYGGGSMIDDIQGPGVWKYLLLTVSLFAVVGVGYGLTFWLFSEIGEFDGTAGQLLTVFGSIFGFFLGPVVAIFSGAYTALDSPVRDDTTLAVANALGSVVGFVVMVVVLIVFLALGGDGGGGGGGGGDGGDLPGGVGGTVGLLVGIAVSSALTVYLTRWLTRQQA